MDCGADGQYSAPQFFLLVAQGKRMRSVEFSNIALAAIAVVLVSMVLLVVVY
jgi:hypothetical protein